MKISTTTIRKGITTLIALTGFLFGNNVIGQQSLSTVPPLNGGNGSGGVSFNVTANNAVIVTAISSTVYGSASGPYEIWYNTTAINGAPSVTTANGWVLAATGTVTPGGTGTTNNPPVTLPSTLNIPMGAGATYGFFINLFSTSPNTAYTTWNAANQSTFTDGNITINNGQNVGYGGPGPNPIFHPRQFNGAVFYSLASQVPDDAGVTEILQPISYCSGETVALVAKVRNFGTAQLDSCLVLWDVNGTLDSAWFNVGLDTFGGTGNIDTTLFIDSISPGTAGLDLYVYTKWPNGVLDSNSANDSAYINILGPALSGTYVIGASAGADFPSFTAAAAALTSSGLCDAVVMEVESGTYNEQFSLASILGSSSANTIVFRSQSGDSSDVILTTANSSPIVTLNNTDWITFESLTFQNTSTFYDIAISFTGGCDSLEIANCHFIGNFASTSTNAALVSSTTGNDNGTYIHNNLFEGSGYGVYIYGSSTVSLESGVRLDDNRFINQYYHAVRLYYLDAPKIRGNYITSNSLYTFGAGFYMLYCDNAMEMSNNHVVTDPTSANPWPYYGIYMTLCDGAGISNTGRIFNNRIIVGADTNSTSTSTFYAVFLSSTNAQRFANNTFTVMKGGTIARAYYQSSSNLIYLENNLFTTYAPSHAGYFLSGITIDQDRNNYYAPYGTEIYFNASNYTVEDFSAATGYDVNSWNADPQWSNIYEGFLCSGELDNQASNINYVTTDYSGFPRGNNPDPGAVEFISIANFNLGGDDTICGNTVTLDVAGAASNVSWSVNGNTSSNNSVVVTNNGTTPQVFNVLVALTSATGCGSTTDNVLLTLVPNAELDSNSHVCANQTVTLSPGGGSQATYAWTPTGENTSSIIVNTPGVYAVTKSELGCTSSASILVTLSQGVELLDVEVCDTDMPFVADASIQNGLNYAWNGGLSPTTAANTFTEAGIYSVTTTDEFGCASEGSFTLTVIDEPVVVITHSHVNNFYSFSSANSLSVGSTASYFWNFGDGNTSTDPNPQHAYPWSGSPVTYTVSLSIINDCGSDQSNTIIGVDPLAVEELGSIELEIFPNPADEQLFIQTGAPLQNATVRITDLSGRTVMESSFTTLHHATLNVSDLAGGSYIVAIQSGQLTTFKPFIIH